MANQQNPPPSIGKGIVKQINSGDTIIIRGPPKGGPPEEIIIGLAGITAPKLARRPANNGEGATKDEPFAWEAKEYLRKRLVGKRVCFAYDKNRQAESADKSGKNVKHYGMVYDGEDTTSENMTEALVALGLVDVRRTNKHNEYVQRLCELEDAAKAAGKGKHAPNASEHIRKIQWSIDDPQEFKDSIPPDFNSPANAKHHIPIPAIVEHVVDGSTLRVCMYSDWWKDFYYAKVMLTGIRCCGFVGDDQKPEPFALEAKFFTESRLLQRDVTLLIDMVQNKNFVCTVLHPKGNIAEFLVMEGFAKCIDWQMNYVARMGSKKLKEAEKIAQDCGKRLWKDYKEVEKKISDDEKNFEATVIEVINADALLLRVTGKDGPKEKKIFLSSVRPPRMTEGVADTGKSARPRPLYDIPYMLEAREFLRKKLIGKVVELTVDYIQPANSGFPEKICCTVTTERHNIAEALIAKGLGTAVRYRADDDQRSSCYDELLNAEAKAKKSEKGLHSKKSPPNHRIVDLTGDLKSSKQYFSVLQRAGKINAVVEFVASGSRMRLFLPRHNYLITFLLAGITCPSASRKMPTFQPGDAFGDEALKFVRDKIMHLDVVIEIDSMDKAGNYIGWLHDSSSNLSECLLTEGLAEIHPSAVKSSYYPALKQAQIDAQTLRLGIWEKRSLEEPKKVEEVTERVISYKKITITGTSDDLTNLMFYAQHFEEGPKLEEMMIELRQELDTNPPLIGSYTPRKGDLCAAKYSVDKQWYRAKVLKIQANRILVSFIDFGNKEQVGLESLCSLPSKHQNFPAGAHEYALAFIKLPKDIDSAHDARNAFFDKTDGASLLLNVEYKNSAISFVTLVQSDSKEDIGKDLIRNGYVLVEKAKEKKFQKVVAEYSVAQEEAKKNRANLWVYGDITEDDDKEFG